MGIFIGVIFILITFTIVIPIIILMRTKSRLRSNLEREGANKIYDEIDPVPQVCTEENIAYGHNDNTAKL